MKEDKNTHVVDFPVIVNDFLSYMESVKSCSVRTAEAYRNDLMHYVKYCDNHDITPEKAEAYQVQSFIAELTAEKNGGGER